MTRVKTAYRISLSGSLINICTDIGFLEDTSATVHKILSATEDPTSEIQNATKDEDLSNLLRTYFEVTHTE